VESLKISIWRPSSWIISLAWTVLMELASVNWAFTWLASYLSLQRPCCWPFVSLDWCPLGYTQEEVSALKEHFCSFWFVSTSWLWCSGNRFQCFSEASALSTDSCSVPRTNTPKGSYVYWLSIAGRSLSQKTFGWTVWLLDTWCRSHWQFFRSSRFGDQLLLLNPSSVSWRFDLLWSIFAHFFSRFIVN